MKNLSISDCVTPVLACSGSPTFGVRYDIKNTLTLYSVPFTWNCRFLPPTGDIAITQVCLLVGWFVCLLVRLLWFLKKYKFNFDEICHRCFTINYWEVKVKIKGHDKSWVQKLKLKTKIKIKIKKIKVDFYKILDFNKSWVQQVRNKYISSYLCQVIAVAAFGLWVNQYGS